MGGYTEAHTHMQVQKAQQSMVEETVSIRQRGWRMSLGALPICRIPS